MKQISTLKIKSINAIVGSDTKTLTDDELIQSYFKDEYDEADAQTETMSWDAVHRDVYFKAIEDDSINGERFEYPSPIAHSPKRQGSVIRCCFWQKGRPVDLHSRR